MSENNENIKNEKKRFFLWSSNEEIEIAVKNYDSEKWYKSHRGIVVLFVLFQLLVGFAIGFLNCEELSALGIVLFPILYLSGRGYRPFLLLLAVYYSLDKFIIISEMHNMRGGAIAFWMITMAFIIAAYRVSHIRAKSYKVSGKKMLKDCGISVLMAVVSFVAAAGCFVYKRIDDKSIMAASAGVVLTNTQWIEQHCANYDIDMKNYTMTFSQTYAKEIQKLTDDFANENVDFVVLQKALLEDKNFPDNLQFLFKLTAKALINPEAEKMDDKEICRQMNEKPQLITRYDFDDLVSLANTVN